jgi:hypothetical protein
MLPHGYILLQLGGGNCTVLSVLPTQARFSGTLVGGFHLQLPSQTACGEPQMWPFGFLSVAHTALKTVSTDQRALQVETFDWIRS